MHQNGAESYEHMLKTPNTSFPSEWIIISVAVVRLNVETEAWICHETDFFPFGTFQAQADILFRLFGRNLHYSGCRTRRTNQVPASGSWCEFLLF